MQAIVLNVQVGSGSLHSGDSLLRTAGAVAPELADLARQVEARRRQNQGRLVAYLDEHRMLRQGLLLEEATDLLWTLTTPGLSSTLAIWRNTWTDSLALARHAREFIDAGLRGAQVAPTEA